MSFGLPQRKVLVMFSVLFIYKIHLVHITIIKIKIWILNVFVKNIKKCYLSLSFGLLQRKVEVMFSILIIYKIHLVHLTIIKTEIWILNIFVKNIKKCYLNYNTLGIIIYNWYILNFQIINVNSYYCFNFHLILKFCFDTFSV